MGTSSDVYYKSPFGIEYTELEEIRLRRVCRAAKKFMESYGKGTQPLIAGYIRKRKAEIKRKK